ncbi:50S ribosomal protein L33 [bacterium]|nr:50S ribosomal protein L33 [bacterium]
MRVIITLRCEQEKCGHSYTTSKNKRTTNQRIQLRKYCKCCRGQQLFKETK